MSYYYYNDYAAVAALAGASFEIVAPTDAGHGARRLQGRRHPQHPVAFGHADAGAGASWSAGGRQLPSGHARRAARGGGRVGGGGASYYGISA